MGVLEILYFDDDKVSFSNLRKMFMQYSDYYFVIAVINLLKQQVPDVVFAY